MVGVNVSMKKKKYKFMFQPYKQRLFYDTFVFQLFCKS